MSPASAIDIRTPRRLADADQHSIAVLSADGRLVESHSAGSAVLPIYSLTKTFIAACVVQSNIDLNLCIDRWFDGDWVPEGAAISVAQLLNHSSGISDYFSESQAYASAVTQRQPPWSDSTYADHTLRKPLLFPPGTSFTYSNPGFWLLGQILQKETGRELPELIAGLIAEPLELDSLHWAKGSFADDLPDYAAEWVWHGLLLASANDVARFMASDLIAPLHKHSIAVPGGHPSWNSPHYGYGLMIEPGERFGHNGEGPGFSASCYHYLNSGLTLCVLTRVPENAQEEAAMRQLIRLHEELS